MGPDQDPRDVQARHGGLKSTFQLRALVAYGRRLYRAGAGARESREAVRRWVNSSDLAQGVATPPKPTLKKHSADSLTYWLEVPRRLSYWHEVFGLGGRARGSLSVGVRAVRVLRLRVYPAVARGG
eukprot:2128791-Prymnesium_polylepis.1